MKLDKKFYKKASTRCAGVPNQSVTMGDGMAGIPALCDRRLSVLQRQLNHSRKRTTITNDKLKESLGKATKSMNRNKQSDSFRSWQKTIPVKNSLVEIRALKKCLRKRRESSCLEPELTPRNGVYDGASLDSMRSEVESIISEKAPRERRLRKVEQLKSDGHRDGKLVDYHACMEKFQNLLSRPRFSLPTWAPLSGGLLARGEMPLGDMFRCDSPSEDSDSYDDDSSGRPPSPVQVCQ
nr:hypothetical protein BaRGS_033063 [Batillaria attramentaria]